jgi:phosphatidate cytidylyltransferase
MFRAVGQQPHRWATHVGSLMALLGACVPIAFPQFADDVEIGGLGLLMLGVGAGFTINVLVELWQYVTPGKTITQLALATFAVIYVGGLLGFLVQLRLLDVGGDVSKGGMLTLFSMIATVKFTDIGAYFAGHRFGKHKMAPVISPGKTWEGAAGGLVLGTLAAIITLGPLARALSVPTERDWLPWLGGAITYGLIVSASGMIGDLAESLLKRDAGVKDSSTWLPGFGGVLDLLDSLLLAAPVAYVLWASGVVTP